VHAARRIHLRPPALRAPTWSFPVYYTRNFTVYFHTIPRIYFFYFDIVLQRVHDIIPHLHVSVRASGSRVAEVREQCPQDRRAGSTERKKSRSVLFPRIARAIYNLPRRVLALSRSVHRCVYHESDFPLSTISEYGLYAPEIPQRRAGADVVISSSMLRLQCILGRGEPKETRCP